MNKNFIKTDTDDKVIGAYQIPSNEVSHETPEGFFEVNEDVFEMSFNLAIGQYLSYKDGKVIVESLSNVPQSAVYTMDARV